MEYVNLNRDFKKKMAEMLTLTFFLIVQIYFVLFFI